MGGSVSKPAEKAYQNLITYADFSLINRENYPKALEDLFLLYEEIQGDLGEYSTIYNCKDIVNKATVNQQDHALQQRVLAGTSCCTIVAARFLIILRSFANAFCAIIDKIAKSEDFVRLDRKLIRNDIRKGSPDYHTELTSAFRANSLYCYYLSQITYRIVKLDMLKVMTPDLLNGVTYYRKFAQGRGIGRVTETKGKFDLPIFNLYNFDTGLASMLLANSVTGPHLLKVTLIEDSDSFFSSGNSSSLITKMSEPSPITHSRTDSTIDLPKIYIDWQHASCRQEVLKRNMGEKLTEEREEPVTREIVVEGGKKNINEEEDEYEEKITIASAGNESNKSYMVPENSVRSALIEYGIPKTLTYNANEHEDDQLDTQLSIIRRRSLVLTAIVKTSASLLAKKTNGKEENVDKVQSLLACSSYALNMLLPVINEQQQNSDKAGLLGKSTEVSPSWLLKTLGKQSCGWYILDTGLSEMFKKEGSNQKEVKAILKLKK